MLSNVTTLCFVLSYAVALALECLRFVWQSPWRRFAVIGWVGAGLIAHTAYLAERASQVGASPLSSHYDWYLLAAWLLTVVYLLQVFYYPKISLGLFVLPLILAIIFAAQFADKTPFASVHASRVWGAVHGSFLLLGTVAVLVGAVSALMYLLQSQLLKQKKPPSRGFRLPSLEWLERINSRSLALSALLMGVGFISGLVLNQIIHTRSSEHLIWNDPTVLSLSVMSVWLVIAELFRLAYRPARQGRKLAYLNLASFVFLSMTLATLLFFEGAHTSSGPPSSQSSFRRSPAEQEASDATKSVGPVSQNAPGQNARGQSSQRQTNERPNNQRNGASYVLAENKGGPPR